MRFLRRYTIAGIVILVALLMMPVPARSQDTVADPGFFGYPLKYQRVMHFNHPYPEDSGFYVYRVNDESRAARAGLEAGSIIRSINGHPVRTLAEVVSVITRDRSDTFVFDVEEIAPRFERKLRGNPFYEIQRTDIYENKQYKISYRRPSPKPITVYRGADGRMYHRQGFQHSPSPRKTKSYENPSVAAEHGLEPCPICFPKGDGSIVSNLIRKEVTDSTNFVKKLKRKYDTVRDVPGDLREMSVRLFRQRLRRRIDPSVLLVETDKLHGFGLRNGTLLLSQGLLDLMEGRGEKAAQIAHQMAHMDLDHSATPVQKARFQSLIEQAINRTTGVNFSFEDLKEYSPDIPGFRYYSELIEQGYGERQERQVTFFAMVYLYKAGFDMDGVSRIMAKRADMESEVHPLWLEYVLKHPYPSDIRGKIKEWKTRIPQSFHRNISP